VASPSIPVEMFIHCNDRVFKQRWGWGTLGTVREVVCSVLGPRRTRKVFEAQSTKTRLRVVVNHCNCQLLPLPPTPTAAPAETARPPHPDSWGQPGSSTSIQNKGPVPSSIEPLRQPRNSSQAKHVPRGQRGLGRGSIAVSCGAIFILLHHLHRRHLVNSLIHFHFPLGLGLRMLRQRRLNQHTRRAPIHRTRRVPQISLFHRIERIVLGRGIIPFYRLIFRHFPAAPAADRPTSLSSPLALPFLTLPAPYPLAHTSDTTYS